MRNNKNWVKTYNVLFGTFNIKLSYEKEASPQKCLTCNYSLLLNIWLSKYYWPQSCITFSEFSVAQYASKGIQPNLWIILKVVEVSNLYFFYRWVICKQVLKVLKSVSGTRSFKLMQTPPVVQSRKKCWMFLESCPSWWWCSSL